MFAGRVILAQSVPRPLLAWAAPLVLDRSVEYYLRARPDNPASAGID